MNPKIKSGDVVSLGGAVGIAPEACDCGKPATGFEIHAGNAASPGRVEGLCGECAALRRWFSGLSYRDQTIYSESLGDLAAATPGDSDYRLAAERIASIETKHPRG